MRKLTISVVFVFGVVFNGVAARILSQNDLRIIGGDEVDITEFPYQVSVVLSGDHHCGGSIISEEYVLTAAHCVFYFRAEDFQVRAGSFYVQGGKLYDVEFLLCHPKFNNVTIDYDIALIKISGKFEIDGETLDVVKLADAGSELNAGDLVTASGWGATTSGRDISSVLKATTLPIVDKRQCYKSWQKEKITITDRMVCAGFKEPGQSTCNRDSGGPLVDKNLIQYGVVSFGAKGCRGIDLPDVFANVANLRAWIQQNTGV